MKVTFPKLVFFDLDGTIVEPMDFNRVRSLLGVNGPILESIWGDDEKLRILKEFEVEHAKNAKLMPYADFVLNYLESLGIVRVLITRNCFDSVRIVCRRFKLKFDEIVTREMGHFKPSPYHVVRIIEKRGFDRRDCLIVGDHEFDVLTGKNAGIKTALLGNSFKADINLRDLKELLSYVRFG